MYDYIKTLTIFGLILLLIITGLLNIVVSVKYLYMKFLISLSAHGFFGMLLKYLLLLLLILVLPLFPYLLPITGFMGLVQCYNIYWSIALCICILPLVCGAIGITVNGLFLKIYWDHYGGD